jgi:8-oxo-dGTP diphosphatase
LKTQEDFAVAVMIETPFGFPMVRDPQKPLPHYWKFPGGRSFGTETPIETALRQTQEEVGITLSVNNLLPVRKEWCGNHFFYFYSVKLTKRPTLLKCGNEGEEVCLVPRAVLLAGRDVHPRYLRYARQLIGR